MQKISTLLKRNKELIKYGICGLITVFINLILYKLFLELDMYYLVASILSYIIASLISYYFNVLLVFSEKIEKFKAELKRIIEYFSVRVGSLLVDTFLLYVAVDILNQDKFISKIIISVLIILVTYFFNKKIIKKNK